jgi:hypothetical protein
MPLPLRNALLLTLACLCYAGRVGNPLQMGTDAGFEFVLSRKGCTLSPLESADPKNAPVTLLQSALPNLKDLKSFRISTYEKGGGRGVGPVQNQSW